MKKRFLRRSILYVPGSSSTMIAKALGLKDVDGIIFDLEDAVAPSEKEKARALVRETLSGPGGRVGRAEVLVRVNPLSSPYAFDDFAALFPCAPHAVVLPKASRHAVIAADLLLEMLERKHGLPLGGTALIPLIETADAVENITGILDAAPRISAAQFGAEDFTREMEVARTNDSAEIVYSRNRLAVACRARGVDCLDTPYADFRDQEGCERDTRYAKSIGMTGRTVIHPSQVAVVNRVFSPTPEEIAQAEKIIQALAAAEAKGLGAVALDGKMIDAPVVDRARAVLRKAGAGSPPDGP